MAQQVAKYGVIGGSIWGNRGAEAMVVTTIGMLRREEPDAEFVIFTYFPGRDRQLVTDPKVTVVDATPAALVKAFAVALLMRIGLRPAGRLSPLARALAGCTALLNVDGVAFIDSRLKFVIYNVFTSISAFVLQTPVIRLSQAMGPFKRFANRLPARQVLRRTHHVFARGRVTGEFLDDLPLIADRWSIAADVAFAYEPEFSLTEESPDRVAGLTSALREVTAAGTTVVAVVPSVVVGTKIDANGLDYIGLLERLVRDLADRGCHVVVMPHATREGEDSTHNNDLPVIADLRARLGAADLPVTWMDFDANTRSIREVIALCDLVVTSRFHAMVAALALEVPTLVVGWSHKYAEVLEMFGLERSAVDYHADPEQILVMTAAALTRLDETRSRIGAHLPSVRESARGQFTQIPQILGRG